MVSEANTCYEVGVGQWDREAGQRVLLHGAWEEAVAPLPHLESLCDSPILCDAVGVCSQSSAPQELSCLGSLAVQIMENIRSCLNCCSELWQFLNTNPRCTTLSAVVLLFLFLYYLLLKPLLPTLWRNEDTPEVWK